MDKVYAKITVLISAAAPYFFCLYFFEVIYISMLAAMIAGKGAAVLTGMTLSGLLAAHLILLNSGRELNRKIQMILMDIHSAFSFAFAVNYFTSDIPTGTVSALIVSVRTILMAGGIAGIISFSSAKIKIRYS